MRIAVIGAGGVGGVFGGLLARAGHDVAFVARGPHLEAIRADGLRVNGPWGTFTVHPSAGPDPASVAGGPPFDAVLVAVKAGQVADVAGTLRPLLGAETVVVPLQNGVDAAETLAAELGDGPVVGGLCHVFGWQEEPGVVRTTGTPLRITMGERAGSGSPRLARLAAALRRAGVEAHVVDDVAAAAWEKFLFIEPFGAVGAVTRVPLGAMRSDPRTRALLVAAVEEVAEVARGRGVRIAPDAVERTVARYDELPAESTASLQRDVMAGRPSELREQTGAVVRIGEEASVPVPIHRFLLAALVPQEAEARSRAKGPAHRPEAR
jgi:2-dehydropantoate 2-reductase